MIYVIPQKAGDLEITSVEWELFEVVKCSRSLKGLSAITSSKKSGDEMAHKFKIIEESGEIDTQIILDGQDITSDKHVIFSGVTSLIFGTIHARSGDKTLCATMLGSLMKKYVLPMRIKASSWSIIK